MKQQKIFAIYALVAALFFGASAPLTKLLLDEVQPVQMASFLYLGSAAGLGFYALLRCFSSGGTHKEAGLKKHDIPWLAGATLSGGVLAPIALMLGLKYTPAATASLLLNFESVATALIAVAVFREAIDKRIWMAVVFITIASILLSIDVQGKYGFSISAASVLLACVFWGLDNNLTRHISSKDPVLIVVIKGAAAGVFVFITSLATGCSMPGPLTLFLSLLVGLCCYGFSIVFFILAMRGLGSARTGAYFALAPFIGTALSFVIFQDMPNTLFIVSLPILIAGVILLFRENHSHLHVHCEMEHEHSHNHDDIHHWHLHDTTEQSMKHSHPHKHEYMVHAHPHAPDIHHRHQHKNKEQHDKEENDE